MAGSQNADPPARLGLPIARQGIGLVDDHYVAIDA